MIKSFLTNCVLFFCLSFIFTRSKVNAQQTVFTETFNTPGTPQSPNFTTTGPIGTSKWAVTRSGGDMGAKIDGGMLTLTNDATSAANAPGWVMASTSTSNFNSLYKSILSQNVGVVSWTFNMRQIRPNPSGLGGGKFGSAFILAGTPGTTNSSGKGYAIALGQNTTTDPIRLITYSNGLAAGTSVKITSSTTGLKDFGAEYTSIRVEYNPADNKWSLYLRKDNQTSFNDPKEGNLVFQDEVVITDFVNEPLTMMGAYWNANKAKNSTAFFDNISVSVETPELISLDPDSKIANTGAFTLTLNGEGFLPSSKVYWNGALRTTTYVSETQLKAAIVATDLATAGTRQITVANGSFISNALPFTIETAGLPVLTLSATSLPAVSTVTGAFSNPTNTYTINGANLNAGATVTAPVNFEISVDGINYYSFLTLPYTEGQGTLTGQPITLRARIKNSAPAGNYTGNISHASPNALTKLVAVSGRVFAAEPTSNATGVSFTNITSTGFKLNWIGGNGAQRLVLIKEAAAVSTLPSDGITYNANAAFGTGSQIGTGNFVAYKGAGTSVQITGLQPSTVYHISIVEFNGLPATENYRSDGATGNTTTLNSPAGLQVKLANTSYKINFDDTVDGVNLDTFQGIGMSKIVESGQLDSNSWAFSGFSGGNIAFAGNSVEDSSYENGPSDGEEDDTGIYAFNVGNSNNPNYTLGIQPGGTGTSADFNPGSITLRIQNQTGATMTSASIGYKVYVYNDQAASSRIRFSYSSSATGTYTDQIIADVDSPTTADLAPGWKAYYRVVTIPTGNIANNAYYYIRWSGSLVSGTGAQDEFGIDDIEVIANPTTTFASFDGIAEDFVLQGNASLSNDLSVQNRLLFNGGKLAIKEKTLTIAGKVENTIANGLTGGATSKLVVRGNLNPFLSFDQTTPGTTNLFDSFSLIGATANSVTVQDGFSVNQLLRVDEQQTLNLGTNILSGNLTSIQNNGIIRIQNTTATPFASGKTWGGTGILNMNATSAAQTLVAGTYNNLTLSSTAGTTAAADVTVNGKLDLPAANASSTKGSLDMGAFTLTMGPDGTNTGIGDVTGIIRRNYFTTNKLYTFGHPNSSITFPPAGTLPTSMSAKLTIGVAPTWKAGTILRQFDIIQTGAVGTKAIIRQHYLDSELNSNVESKLVFWGHKTTVPVTTFDQGRSNNNTDENWVEITNADISLYFEPTFDKVYITLDESEANVLTWNGSVSTSWNSIANWTPNNAPTEDSKVIIPIVSSSSNRSPIIDVNSNVQLIIIEAGGTVNVPADAQLTVSGGAGAWQNNGTFNPGTGTSKVTFKNADATIAGNTSFNNLTIAAGAGLHALDGNYMSIAGTLTNNGTMFTTLIPNTIEFKGTNQVIPTVGGDSLGGYHNLIVTGTGATIASTTLNVRGNLTLDQFVSFTGKTINLAGVSDQTIGGTAAINFSNLIVNKEAGAVILAKDIAVGGTLTLTKGNVVIGDKNLTLGINPVVGTFGTNTMIVADGTGVVRRPFTGVGSYLFPIGELAGAPSYAPITVNITAGTFSNAFVGVNAENVKHPNNNSSQNYLRKYWNVTQTGITGAVATITGKYDALDILGAETEISAAQLNGTFNLTTNPWIKFGALTNNTLVATNATLTNGQTSSFTGLKAGDFTLEVYGYGDFCIGSTHTMDAVISGGDAPFTYMWSNGLPNSDEVEIPTTTVGTTNYTLTVRDANGFSAVDNVIPVYIFPSSVGGTVSNASQQICTNSLSADLQLTGSVGKVLHWQKSTDADFTTFENISNFTTTLTGSEIGPVNATTYIRAVLQNGDCDESVSNIATITIKSTTWNGVSWSNGEPDSSTSAIFAADYSETSNINACTIVIKNGTAVKIPAGFNVIVGTITVESGGSLIIMKEGLLTVTNGIINNAGIANFVVESDANLVQINDEAVNSGAITVRRIANIKRLDYVYWSSPVNGQVLKTFSPGTLNNRFLEYNEGTDLFTAVTNVNADFVPAKGYAIRASNTQSNTKDKWTGNFIGTPNNGVQEFKLAYSYSATNHPDGGYNLVGNPYPSNISFDGASGLHTLNSAVLENVAYFWTNVNANVSGTTYKDDNYAMLNGSGTRAAQGSDVKPTGIIKVGQGFIVKAKTNANGQNLVFNNSVRSADSSIFFDKNTKEGKDRFWLKLTTPSKDFTTVLVAYVPNATNNFELSYDAPMLSMSSDAIFSILNEYKLGIQGRQFPLNTNDIVAIGTNHYTAGDHVISLQETEGVFANGQNIYLKDRANGILANLSEKEYRFTANAGLTENRFEIRYQPEIVLGTDTSSKENLIIYRDGNDFVVKSSTKTISDVEVYDVSGRLLLKLNPNHKETRIDASNFVNGTYVLKITSASPNDQKGNVVTKKIVK
ncbi:T9SS type A sorting domain-containing protein [Kaistella flava (ex Peng et al. 2021)]|nr:T9SS type A sorting domain-containing protein [Kaistella flava (ex Peng et al. 2021)]